MRKVSRAPLRLQCVSKKNYSLLFSLSSYLNMQRAHGSAYYFMPFFRSHTATSSSSFAYLRPPGQRAQVITAATTMRASASKQDVSRRNSQTDKYVRCHPWWESVRGWFRPTSTATGPILSREPFSAARVVILPRREEFLESGALWVRDGARCANKGARVWFVLFLINIFMDELGAC